MTHEKPFNKVKENWLKVTQNINLSKTVSAILSLCTVSAILSLCKEKYTQIMDWYCHWLDKKWVSPNQVVTWRVIAWTGTGLALASWDYGPFIESTWVGILWITLIHDAVDGHLARLTQQTSKNGETLDAWGDKVKVFILLAILLSTIDVNLITLASLIWAAWVALILDIKSQLLRDNNIEAFKACLQSPLTQSERDNNPNEKSPWAAVSAGKAKTGVIMGWITLWFMEDIPGFEWSNDNAIPLLISLVIANWLSIKSLKDKWVTLWNFFQKWIESNPKTENYNLLDKVGPKIINAWVIDLSANANHVFVSQALETINTEYTRIVEEIHRFYPNNKAFRDTFTWDKQLYNSIMADKKSWYISICWSLLHEFIRECGIAKFPIETFWEVPKIINESIQEKTEALKDLIASQIRKA